MVTHIDDINNEIQEFIKNHRYARLL